MPETLSIIVPCYNEAKTLPELLRRLEAADIGEMIKQIIIVDDGSTDGTKDFLKSLPSTVTVVSRTKNGGKGSAIREGLRHVCGEYVVIQDADLEYDPADLKALLNPIISGECDVVYGSRELRTGNRKHSGLSFYLGARFLTWTTNRFFGCALTDMPTCYKAFRREVITALPLQSCGFEFCPEVTAKLLKRKHRILEVPISYAPRSVADGKKIRWTDGITALSVLIKERFK